MTKRFILLTFLIAFLFFNLPLAAQITLQKSDLGQAGDAVDQVATDLQDPKEAQSGNHQVWDYSHLAPSGDTSETAFTDPSDTRFASDFPNATYAQTTGNRLEFYQLSTTSLSLQGFVLDVADVELLPLDELVLDLKPNLQSLKLPATLGTNFSGSTNSQVTFAVDTSITVPEFGTVPVDSVRLTIGVDAQSNFDGAGTLKLPNAEDTVLRQKSVITNTVKAEAYAFVEGGGVIPDQQFWVEFPLPDDIEDQLPSVNLYRYWAKGSKLPLLDVTTDTSGDSVLTARMQPQNITSLAPHHAEQPLRFFPNPVKQQVTFELPQANPQALNLQIFDPSGRLVMSRAMRARQLTLDLGRLTQGLYHFRLLNRQGQLLKQGRLLKQ